MPLGALKSEYITCTVKLVMEAGQASALSQVWRQDCTHIIYIHNFANTFAHSPLTTGESIPGMSAFAYRIYDT